MEGLVSCMFHLYFPFIIIIIIIITCLYAWGTHNIRSDRDRRGPLSSGEKQPGSDADLSPKIKNGAISPLPCTSS